MGSGCRQSTKGGRETTRSSGERLVTEMDGWVRRTFGEQHQQGLVVAGKGMSRRTPRLGPKILSSVFENVCNDLPVPALSTSSLSHTQLTGTKSVLFLLL